MVRYVCTRDIHRAVRGVTTENVADLMLGPAPGCFFPILSYSASPSEILVCLGLHLALISISDISSRHIIVVRHSSTKWANIDIEYLYIDS
jgi:hypothetical protein